MSKDHKYHSAHLLDPEIAPFLNLWPIKELSARTLASSRALLREIVTAQAAASNGRAAENGIIREEVIIPGSGDQPDIRAIIHRPAERRTRPGYFHVHGGGFVMGAPEFTEDRDRRVVLEHGCVVISPAYRLAPETKFPGAVEDLYTALKWFRDNASILGVDPETIIVGGESAGGGHAAALTTLARDRGEIAVAGQMLMYPMIDDRTGSTINRGPFAGEFLWTPENNRFGWSSLLPCEPGSENVSPYAAAARATDLSGLPPTALFVGTLDLFFDENVDYVKRLVNAGVPAKLHIYPGAYHAFDLAGDTRLTAELERDQQESLSWLIHGNR
ncbi:MAG: alpha/beta hydrolase [Novosphingobium sp.]